MSPVCLPCVSHCLLLSPIFFPNVSQCLLMSPILSFNVSRVSPIIMQCLPLLFNVSHCLLVSLIYVFKRFYVSYFFSGVLIVCTLRALNTMNFNTRPFIFLFVAAKVSFFLSTRFDRTWNHVSQCLPVSLIYLFKRFYVSFFFSRRFDRNVRH
jgi:hypothetical protein